MTTNYLIPNQCSTDGCAAPPKMVIVHEHTKQHVVGCSNHWGNIARILDGGDPIEQHTVEDIEATAQIVNYALEFHATYLLQVELANAPEEADDGNPEGS